MPTRYVVGIDPSLSGCGVIVLDESAAVAERQIISSPPSGGMVRDRMSRIGNMVGRIVDVLAIYAIDVICIEGYSLGSNMPGVSDRVEFGGVLRYAIYKKGYRLVEIAPSSLKKWASGKGNGDKTATIAGITARYGMQFQSSDEYDAYGLARIAFQIAGHEQGATKEQRDVISVAISGKPKKPEKKSRSARPRSQKSKELF